MSSQNKVAWVTLQHDKNTHRMSVKWIILVITSIFWPKVMVGLDSLGHTQFSDVQCSMVSDYCLSTIFKFCPKMVSEKCKVIKLIHFLINLFIFPPYFTNFHQIFPKICLRSSSDCAGQKLLKAFRCTKPFTCNASMNSTRWNQTGSEVVFQKCFGELTWNLYTCLEHNVLKIAKQFVPPIGQKSYAFVTLLFLNLLGYFFLLNLLVTFMTLKCFALKLLLAAILFWLALIGYQPDHSQSLLYSLLSFCLCASSISLFVSCNVWHDKSYICL